MKIEEIEIVGFNGAILVDCARSEPIARQKEKDIFFIFANYLVTHEPKITYIKTEIDDLNNKRKLTLLHQPVPAVLSGEVVYVTERFLKAFDYEEPENLSRDFAWQRIDQSFNYAKPPTKEFLKEQERLKEGIWAACASKNTVEKEMNNWGRNLMRKATDRMIKFYLNQEQHFCEEAEHLANMALFAARSRSLRARIYVCYGTAIMESQNEYRLDNMFEQDIKRRFPDWRWEMFKARLNRFSDILRLKAHTRAQRETLTQKSEVYVNPNVLQAIKTEIDWQVSQLNPRINQEDLEVIAEDMDRFGSRVALIAQSKDGDELVQNIFTLLRLISQVGDVRTRFEMCQQVAKQCDKIFSLDKNTIRRTTHRISSFSPSFPLDKASLEVLTTSPAFFYRPAIKIRPNRRPLFMVSDYLDTVSEIQNHDLPIDEVAQLISESKGYVPLRVAANG